MIPVDISVLQKIDLHIRSTDTPQIIAYKELMKDQLSWCQANQDIILKRANQLYDIVTKYPDKNKNLVHRCCDFIKLETILDKYIKNTLSTESNKRKKSHITLSQIKKNSEIISKKQKEQHKNNPKKDKEFQDID